MSIVSIALWSPDYKQMTGQALVTARVVRHQPSISWSQYVYQGKGWRSATSWVGAALRLWRDVVRRRVKILYLVCSRSNGGFLRDIPALLAAWAGVRVVAHVHGSDIVDLLSTRRLSPLAQTLYARCTLIVPSTHLLEPLRRVTAAPIHLCENYFAGDLSDEVGKPVRLADAFTALWNSNVMASKGFFDLMEAVQQIRGEGLAVQLISVGQPLGDEEMPAAEAGRRLNRLLGRQYFDYRGKVSQSDAIALLARADAIVLPSRYSSECQPLAIVQAMCAGKAIVVSDIPALRATLRDYPAHFVPTHSVEAIVCALRELYQEKQADQAAFVFRRQKAATSARRRFSAKRFDREMAAILLASASAALS